MSNLSDGDLLKALGQHEKVKKESDYTPYEQRAIAGFEEIQVFVDRHGRLPRNAQGADLFERLYAVRLERIRKEETLRGLLQPLDHQKLINRVDVVSEQNESVASLGDDDLLKQLGTTATSPITELRHVRSHSERRVAEEIATRDPCEDFDRFRPLFDQVERELDVGIRDTHRFGKDASIDEGDFFILGGQFVYVAEKGKEFMTPNRHLDARLRVIYSNATESNLLLRSLQRALYKDDTARRIIEQQTASLFDETLGDGDVVNGTIYVVRSQSDHPFIAKHRDLIHKIGVTGGDVEARIANANQDPTYLLADVDIVATYKLAAVNRRKLESIFHRIFSPARINLTIHDRFGHPVQPREWFFVPLPIIDEAVNRIRDGSIVDVIYEPESASLVEVS